VKWSSTMIRATAAPGDAARSRSKRMRIRAAQAPRVRGPGPEELADDYLRSSSPT
jgi:hypothetical protein